jgi:hypothetical protein
VVLKLKRQPPILVDRYSPAAFLPPLERMQSPARNVHIGEFLSSVEGAELKSQSLSVVRLDATHVPANEQVPQSFVANRDNHSGL